VCSEAYSFYPHVSRPVLPFSLRKLPWDKFNGSFEDLHSDYRRQRVKRVIAWAIELLWVHGSSQPISCMYMHLPSFDRPSSQPREALVGFLIKLIGKRARL
jgi:hypothetical protein